MDSLQLKDFLARMKFFSTQYSPLISVLLDMSWLWQEVKLFREKPWPFSTEADFWVVVDEVFSSVDVTVLNSWCFNFSITWLVALLLPLSWSKNARICFLDSGCLFLAPKPMKFSTFSWAFIVWKGSRNRFVQGVILVNTVKVAKQRIVTPKHRMSFVWPHLIFIFWKEKVRETSTQLFPFRKSKCISLAASGVKSHGSRMNKSWIRYLS